MRRLILILLIFVLVESATAQCSICTKTASQMGEATGRGLNTGIIYLALAPMAICGYLGYRWWKNNKV